jgi:hypothetical protein
VAIDADGATESEPGSGRAVEVRPDPAVSAGKVGDVVSDRPGATIVERARTSVGGELIVGVGDPVHPKSLRNSDSAAAGRPVHILPWPILLFYRVNLILLWVCSGDRELGSPSGRSGP